MFRENVSRDNVSVAVSRRDKIGNNSSYNTANNFNKFRIEIGENEKGGIYPRLRIPRFYPESRWQLGE